MKVALVCIAKNEDKYIQEWVDYHLSLGFDSIFIYQNNWEFEVYEACLINWPGECQQLPAYNHFIQTYGKEYDWVAFLDVDEFLVLKAHHTIQALLLNYTRYTAVCINWVLFGSKIRDVVLSNNNSVIERFVFRQKTCK